MSDPLLDLPVRELLHQVASDTSPGSGAVVALVTALAAGLLAVSARRSTPLWAEAERAAEMADGIRARVAPLAGANAEAYAAARTALRDPEQIEEEVRDWVLGLALDAAAELPLAIAACACEVALLGEAIAGACGPSERPDAVAATLLAAAGTQGAARLVASNLAAGPGDPRVVRASELAAAAARAATAAASGEDG